VQLLTLMFERVECTPAITLLCRKKLIKNLIKEVDKCENGLGYKTWSFTSVYVHLYNVMFQLIIVIKL